MCPYHLLCLQGAHKTMKYAMFRYAMAEVENGLTGHYDLLLVFSCTLLFLFIFLLLRYYDDHMAIKSNCLSNNGKILIF